MFSEKDYKMKVNELTMPSKKVIAREFLMLILLALMGSISFFSTFFYNYINQSQKDSLKTEIEQQTIIKDSLSKMIFQKEYAHAWFFEKVSEEYNVEKYNSVEKWWDRSQFLAKNDSIKIIWETDWKKNSEYIQFFSKIGFPNYDSLQNFIITNSYTKLELNAKNKADSLNNSITELNKTYKATIILSKKQQLKFFWKSIIVLFVLIFVFRHLFYAIKWSIKTLKDK